MTRSWSSSRTRCSTGHAPVTRSALDGVRRGRGAGQPHRRVRQHAADARGLPRARRDGDAPWPPGADVDRINDRGQSPLAGAVFKDEADVVRALARRRGRPRRRLTHGPETAAMFGRERPASRDGPILRRVADEHRGEPVPEERHLMTLDRRPHDPWEHRGHRAPGVAARDGCRRHAAVRRRAAGPDPRLGRQRRRPGGRPDRRASTTPRRCDGWCSGPASSDSPRPT